MKVTIPRKVFFHCERICESKKCNKMVTTEVGTYKRMRTNIEKEKLVSRVKFDESLYLTYICSD